jgi:hypothetical protein
MTTSVVDTQVLHKEAALFLLVEERTFEFRTEVMYCNIVCTISLRRVAFPKSV